MADSDSDKQTIYRAKLGIYVVIGSSIGVVLLGLTVIIAAGARGGAADVQATAQTIFTGLLPLLGTWVGTVLAFYFSKENFESASRSTLDVVRSVSERLKVIRIAEKMMPANSIIKAFLSDSNKLDDLTLKDVQGLFDHVGSNGQKISRVLIVRKDGVCVGILHRSVWMEMLVLGAQQATPVIIQSDALGKVLDLPYQSKVGSKFREFITKTLAYVAQSGTLADAKSAMEAISGCQDVIVTATGKPDEAMLGWLSNVDIARQLQA
ncbi:MAG TPA: hypothetical protein VKX28_16165 [Xanthobacteraceae bacterium]|nr:hypothetical protein [Xanthobacteraceae bacterium]